MSGKAQIASHYINREEARTRSSLFIVITHDRSALHTYSTVLAINKERLNLDHIFFSLEKKIIFGPICRQLAGKIRSILKRVWLLLVFTKFWSRGGV